MSLWRLRLPHLPLATHSPTRLLKNNRRVPFERSAFSWHGQTLLSLHRSQSHGTCKGNWWSPTALTCLALTSARAFFHKCGQSAFPLFLPSLWLWSPLSTSRVLQTVLFLAQSKEEVGMNELHSPGFILRSYLGLTVNHKTQKHTQLNLIQHPRATAAANSLS